MGQKGTTFMPKVNAGTFLFSMSTEPPKIDVETFEPMTRVQEGRKVVVKCQVLGTLPFVTIWSRGGNHLIEKQRGNMFEIISATIYDTGRYSCTVKNPAGEDTKDAYVQIRKYMK